MKSFSWLYLFAQLSIWGVLLFNSGEVWARKTEGRLAQSQPSSAACPEEIEPLTAWMLQDLPSYANRVSQRSGSVGKSQRPKISVFIIGKPEFVPLTLGPGVYSPTKLPEDKEAAKQVFFTSWERYYEDGQIVEFQNYHWAFLARNTSGWRLAALYSSLGAYPKRKSPTPLRESSKGIIGEGIKLWLRDCAAGSLRSSSPTKLR
jgi:hypothetical protein